MSEATSSRFIETPATLAQDPTRQHPGEVLLVSALLMCALIAAVILYLRFSFAIYPSALINSDDATDLLFANEMLQQRTLFPEWRHSTGICLPFLLWVEMFLAPMLAFSSDWMTSFRSAVAIDQLVFAAIAWWVLGRAGMSRSLRAFALVFLFASPSLPYAGQTVLISSENRIHVELLLLAYLAYRAVSDPTIPLRKLWRPCLPLAAAASLLFIDASNISIMLPSLAAAVAATWLGGTFKLRPAPTLASTLYVMAVFVATVALGQSIFHLLPRTAYQPLAPHFVDLKTAADHVSLIGRGLIEWYGAAPAQMQPIYSLSTIVSFAKLCLIGVVFLVPLWLATRWHRLHDGFLGFLIVVFVVELALRLFVYAFTDISQDSTETNRYFIPPALLGLVIVLLFIERNWPALLARSAALGVAVVMLVSSPFATARPTTPSWQQQFVQKFEAQHLMRGYATYFYANQLTAISDNRVQVRPVAFTNGGIIPLHFLSSQSWFEGDATAQQSFLLLNDIFSLNFNRPQTIVYRSAIPHDVENGGFVLLDLPIDLI